MAVDVAVHELPIVQRVIATAAFDHVWVVVHGVVAAGTRMEQASDGSVATKVTVEVDL